MRISAFMMVVLCCIAARPSCAQTNATLLAETLSLEQAYERALSTDQTIRIAFEEIRKANLEPWSALTRMGLRATGEASYEKPERNILGRTNNSPIRAETKRAAIVLEQPLIDLTVFPAFTRGTLSEKSARLAHQFTVRGVLFGVTRAYYEVLKQQRIVQVNRETLDLANRQFTLAENRFKVGDVTKTDVLRGRVSVEQARRALIESENTLRLASNVLSNILNYGTEREYVVADPPSYPSTLPSFEDAQRTASEKREDLRVRKLAIDQSHEDRNEVIAQYGPTLVAQWRNDWIDPETQGSPNDFWEATLAVRVPIFEGGLREVNLRRAGYTINQARLDHENLSKSIEIEVKEAWLRAQTFEQTLKAIQAEVAAAEENYKTLENQYKSGVVTSLDSQNALRDLNSARTDLAVRTYEYQVALRDMERVMGVFQEERVKQVKAK